MSITTIRALRSVKNYDLNKRKLFIINHLGVLHFTSQLTYIYLLTNGIAESDAFCRWHMRMLHGVPGLWDVLRTGGGNVIWQNNCVFMDSV